MNHELFFQNPFYKLILLLTLAGCATGQPGKIKNLQPDVNFVRTKDNIIFKSTESNQWITWDGITHQVKPLFDANFQIKDLNAEKSILIIGKIPSEIEPQNSGLEIYDFIEEKTRKVIIPIDKFYYNIVSLSPNKKILAANIRSTESNNPSLYNDSIFLINLKTFEAHPLKKINKNGFTEDIMWSDDGTYLYSTIFDCTKGGKGQCEFQVLKRSIDNDSIEILDEGAASAINLEAKLKSKGEYFYHKEYGLKKCNNKTISIIPQADSVFSHEIEMKLVSEQSGLEETVVKISDRSQSCGECRRLQHIDPIFTSDCKYIVFGLGGGKSIFRSIYIVDVVDKKVGSIGMSRDSNTYVLPVNSK